MGRKRRVLRDVHRRALAQAGKDADQMRRRRQEDVLARSSLSAADRAIEATIEANRSAFKRQSIEQKQPPR